MHRLHGVERDCEVAGILDVDHKLRPAAWCDLANGAELFAAIRDERLESHFNLLLHDFLPAVINLRPEAIVQRTPGNGAIGEHRSAGTKFEEDLAASIRLQRLIER